jgi:hypothetical protein
MAARLPRGLFLLVAMFLIVSAWHFKSLASENRQFSTSEPVRTLEHDGGPAAPKLQVASPDPEVGKQVEKGVESGQTADSKPQKDSAVSLESSDETRPLKEQIIELQNKGKLGYRRVVLCSAVEGFGMYSPVEGGSVPPRLMLYIEPSNVSTLVKEDRYVIDLSVDLFVIGPTGVPLVAKQNFPIRKVSRSPILDLHYVIGVDLRKFLKQDLITVKTVLHDKIKNQSISHSIKVRLPSGHKKPQESI